MSSLPRRVPISIGREGQLSGLLQVPSRAVACYVLAHGAGAGMDHPFLGSVATELAERAVATLRFQFPFMERGSRRPDSPRVAQETVRAAVKAAAELVPELPLIAGGRSFGGRMASQAQAASALAGVRGLAFVGFPLHPAKRPSVDRANHLFEIDIPMLFLQGTRDDLADLQQLRSVCGQLGDRATLRLFEDADHGFHVRARSGRTDAQIRADIADSVAGWIGSLVGP
jgi:predicted alpha/beta-hydrolase family hydrolase